MNDAVYGEQEKIRSIGSIGRASFQLTLPNLKWSSLRSVDVFPVVASLPPKNNGYIFRSRFGGREATTGNTSVLRRPKVALMPFSVKKYSKS